MATTEPLHAVLYALFLGLVLLLDYFLEVPVAHAQNCSCPGGVCLPRCHGLGVHGWIRFRDSCYQFQDQTTLSHVTAQHACFISSGARPSGELLVIDDEAEDDFVRAYTNCLFKFPTNLNISATFWTGGVSPYTNYSNWFNEKQPHSVDSKRPESNRLYLFDPNYCIALVGQAGFKMQDVKCQERHHTICEAWVPDHQTIG